MKKALLLATVLLFISSASFGQGRVEYFMDTGGEDYCSYVDPATTMFWSAYLFVESPNPAVGFLGLLWSTNIDDSENWVQGPPLTYDGWQVLGVLNWAVAAPAITYPHPTYGFLYEMTATWKLADCMHDPWIYLGYFQIYKPAGFADGLCHWICPMAGRVAHVLQLLDCEYTEYDATTNYCHYVNCTPCPEVVGAQQSSWGAIKSMYSE